jgi:hypothetical protein
VRDARLVLALGSLAFEGRQGGARVALLLLCDSKATLGAFPELADLRQVVNAHGSVAVVEAVAGGLLHSTGSRERPASIYPPERTLPRA